MVHFKKFYAFGSRWLWGALLLVLPLTSFPLASRLFGSHMVAPASAILLAVFMLAWFVPYMLQKGALSWQSVFLLGFLSVTAIGILIALWSNPPIFRYILQWRNNLDAFLTMVIGVCFYLAAATWAKDEEQLRFSLRWINWGGFLLVAWSLLQGFYWYRTSSYPDWMVNVQSYLSSSKFFAERIVGTTYEPSWLAHVLNMIYLPFWLAASVEGNTAHRYRLWKFTFENFLLLGGIACLILSVSRVGMVAFLLMVALLLVFLNVKLLHWLEKKLTASRIGFGEKRFQRFTLRVGLLIGMALVYFMIFAGAAVGFSRFDPRMSKLFDFSSLKNQSFIYYANQLVFAERVVYWETGWNIFNDHPIFGVGLGNAGFYFPQKLSAFSWGLTEVRRGMYELTTLPNIKSMWVRILAETGIFGFSLFVGWLYSVWQSAYFLRTFTNRTFKTIGLAGAFVLIGLLAEGFSVDTFALPYFWTSFGLVTAACALAYAKAK